MRSLPSRGAWIEIAVLSPALKALGVAPLTGSVDRNFFEYGAQPIFGKSLPSRGAWIEMASTLWGPW